MKPRFHAELLALVLAGWMTGAAAQEECETRTATIVNIGDVRAALNCLERRIVAENQQTRKEEENNKKQLLQQITNLDIVTTNVKNIPLRSATNGIWKELPESEGAKACFLTSIRLPPQGLCQITYHGTDQKWTFNISDPTVAGFMCTATCVWTDLVRKQPAANQP
jgi:hypothetical protein